MNIKKNMLSVVAVAMAMGVAGAAYAGPPVTITFKNQGTQPATYSVITGNEVSTNVNASPKPRASIQPQSADTYSVRSLINPDASVASVRYTMGSKTCTFNTTFINQISGGILLPGGPTKIPRWNKTATASGGAICMATITS